MSESNCQQLTYTSECHSIPPFIASHKQRHLFNLLLLHPLPPANFPLVPLLCRHYFFITFYWCSFLSCRNNIALFSPHSLFYRLVNENLISKPSDQACHLQAMLLFPQGNRVAEMQMKTEFRGMGLGEGMKDIVWHKPSKVLTTKALFTGP